MLEIGCCRNLFIEILVFEPIKENFISLRHLHKINIFGESFRLYHFPRYNTHVHTSRKPQTILVINGEIIKKGNRRVRQKPDSERVGRRGWRHIENGTQEVNVSEKRKRKVKTPLRPSGIQGVK